MMGRLFLRPAFPLSTRSTACWMASEGAITHTTRVAVQLPPLASVTVSVSVWQPRLKQAGTTAVLPKVAPPSFHRKLSGLPQPPVEAEASRWTQPLLPLSESTEVFGSPGRLPPQPAGETCATQLGGVWQPPMTVMLTTAAGDVQWPSLTL